MLRVNPILVNFTSCFRAQHIAWAQTIYLANLGLCKTRHSFLHNGLPVKYSPLGLWKSQAYQQLTLSRLKYKVNKLGSSHTHTPKWISLQARSFQARRKTWGPPPMRGKPPTVGGGVFLNSIIMHSCSLPPITLANSCGLAFARSNCKEITKHLQNHDWGGKENQALDPRNGPCRSDPTEVYQELGWTMSWKNWRQSQEARGKSFLSYNFPRWGLSPPWESCHELM